MKRYLKHYFWFWKESFSFMKGANRLCIAWGCLKMAPGFAKSMVEWDKMNREQRDCWYLNSDRTI
jgi:hypothetical protein